MSALAFAASLNPSDPPTSIIPAPIARTDRLKPCAVVLVHTRYDEETRAPTVTRRRVGRLVRL